MMHDHALPLPGLAASRALWPVWSNSAKKPVRWSPMPKRDAARLYHEARRFERQSRSYGRQDGALGRNGLAVLHALVFDFLNYRTGRLDPSIAAIARAACVSVSSAKRGLARLKAAGVLSWVRRCAESVGANGRFMLRQESNAYHVRPASAWRGYAAAPAPIPHPYAWGARPALPDALAVACETAGAHAMTMALESDPADPLARALAALGRAVTGRKA